MARSRKRRQNVRANLPIADGKSTTRRTGRDRRSPKTSAGISWDQDNYYVASFGIHKCRRYHAKLRAFYQGLHNAALGANAVTASGAFVAVLAEMPTLAAWLTGVVAVATSFDVLFGFDARARLHDDLCRRFTELAACIVEWPPTPANLARAAAQRIRIEKDEPTEKRLIDLLAQNEEARCRGVREEDLLPISKLQRVFGYCFTFGLPRLERAKAEAERTSD